jgi:hypothetical protein
MEFLYDWVSWAVVVAFLVALLLPFALLPIWRWYKDSFGVNLQMKDFAIAAALLASFLHRAFGISPNSLWFGWLEAAAITSVPIILVWRFFIILKEQRNGAAEDRARKQEKERKP